MRLTDYYLFERVAVKSKLRMDCIASTESYEPMEEKRARKAIKASDKRDATNVGDLVIYYGDVPENFGCRFQRRADKSITIGGKNMSSVYVLDEESIIAFGDFKGTNDALLFVFHNLNTPNGVIEAGAMIEVFVARGQRNSQRQFCYLLVNGELDEEMNLLRGKAVKSVIDNSNG